MNKKALVLGALCIAAVGGALWAFAGQSETMDAPDTALPSQMPVTSGENPQPGSQVHDLPVEPAAAAARKDLAAKLSLDEQRIVILQITDAEWSDGCLGLGGPAESCLQAVVPGFSVEMLAQGKTYLYRTDTTGTIVRTATQ